MPIIPQRCDYLMTTTFIGVVLLQPPKRKKNLYCEGGGKYPAEGERERKKSKTGRCEC